MTMKPPALALLATLVLAGCSAQHTISAQPAAETAKTAAASFPTNVQKRELASGLYEMALSPQGDALYVASAEGFKDVQGGVVYKLDPATLKTLGSTHTDLKNFGMTISPDGNTVYVTHSLDGGISAIDAHSGKVLARTLFPERNEKGRPYGAREILLHNGVLYVGAVADPALVWVVDAKTLKVKTRIKNAGNRAAQHRKAQRTSIRPPALRIRNRTKWA